MSDDSGKINLRVCCEFGYDLQCAAPFAYWLQQNGKLGTTIGAKGSTALYYFNEKHHIEDELCERNDDSVPDQMNPHKITDFKEWSAPQYKEFYRNNVFIFDQPILFIHNKYAPEWHGPPINFIDTYHLEQLFKILHNQYKIIYHRAKLKDEIKFDFDYEIHKDYAFDKTEREPLQKYNVTPLGDDLIVKKYNISTLESLARAHPEYSFNEVQFMLHANANHFISVQGGNSVVASFFGGINIIYCRRGTELVRSEYEFLYTKFSDVK
eukprot:gene4122-8193_t